MNLRSTFYTLARFMGDVNAAKRGPVAFMKRVVRKAMLRKSGSIINRTIK